MPEQQPTIPDLFRGTPELITKLSRGAGITVRHLGAWWAADKAVRSILLATGTGLTWIYRSWAIPVEIGVFVVASSVARGGAPAATPAPAVPTEPQPAASAFVVDLAKFAEWEVAFADMQGHKGVHLCDLLADLHADGLCTEMDTAALHVALVKAGVPVADQLKLAGVNRLGVRYDELERALGRMPRLAPEDVPNHTERVPDDARAEGSGPPPTPLAPSGRR